jgi:hypothetical protein
MLIAVCSGPLGCGVRVTGSGPEVGGGLVAIDGGVESQDRGAVADSLGDDLIDGGASGG